MNKRDLAEYLLLSVDELGAEESIKTVSNFLLSIAETANQNVIYEGSNGTVSVTLDSIASQGECDE